MSKPTRHFKDSYGEDFLAMTHTYAPCSGCSSGRIFMTPFWMAKGRNHLSNSAENFIMFCMKQAPSEKEPHAAGVHCGRCVGI